MDNRDQPPVEQGADPAPQAVQIGEQLVPADHWQGIPGCQRFGQLLLKRRAVSSGVELHDGQAVGGLQPAGMCLQKGVEGAAHSPSCACRKAISSKGGSDVLPGPSRGLYRR